MSDHSNTPPKSFKQNKDKRLRDQFSIVYRAFYLRPQTMKEVSVKTGIDRANICWFCRSMRLAGTIRAFKKTICTITKHEATQWTTDPNLFPKQAQLPLF